MAYQKKPDDSLADMAKVAQNGSWHVPTTHAGRVFQQRQMREAKEAADRSNDWQFSRPVPQSDDSLQRVNRLLSRDTSEMYADERKLAALQVRLVARKKRNAEASACFMTSPRTAEKILRQRLPSGVPRGDGYMDVFVRWMIAAVTWFFRWLFSIKK